MKLNPIKNYAPSYPRRKPHKEFAASAAALLVAGVITAASLSSCDNPFYRPAGKLSPTEESTGIITDGTDTESIDSLPPYLLTGEVVFPQDQSGIIAEEE